MKDKYRNTIILQVGHPLLMPQKRLDLISIRESFFSIFSENSESAYLFWNKISIRFHYTYELYSNFDDLLNWWEKLAFESSGNYEWTMQTDLFLTTIQSEWAEGQLNIRSKWTEKRSHELLAKKLNEKNEIQMPVMDFLREWKLLMLQILNAFKNAGIELTDEVEKQKLISLQRIADRIYSQGVLYTK